MKVLKIDHLGIAVNSIDEAKKLYQDILGLEFEGTSLPPHDRHRIAQTTASRAADQCSYSVSQHPFAILWQPTYASAPHGQARRG